MSGDNGEPPPGSDESLFPAPPAPSPKAADDPNRRADGTFVKGNKFLKELNARRKAGEPPKRLRRVTYATISTRINNMKVSKVPWAVAIADAMKLNPKALTVGELLVHRDKWNRAKGKASFLKEDLERTEGRMPIRAEITADITVAFMAAAQIVYDTVAPMLSVGQMDFVAERLKQAAGSVGPGVRGEAKN